MFQCHLATDTKALAYTSFFKDVYKDLQQIIVRSLLLVEYQSPCLQSIKRASYPQQSNLLSNHTGPLLSPCGSMVNPLASSLL